MSFANSMLTSMVTFLGYASIPYFAPVVTTKVVELMQFGLMGEMIFGFFTSFMMNWILNFASDVLYFKQECNEFTGSYSTIFWMGMVPALIALVVSVILNFIPILKAPLLFFAVFGGMWIVEAVINIISIYGIASPITWGARLTMKKNSCK